ncbi:MAG: DUF3240 domain-containing protein [Gammaproteobacteria bacterium]|nr:MAG: DUF3240 domain-containing protein [Gammaproteobacteria bacterium]RKZ66785.1 MAG: DUF3240 domain-containing protein [Gammaproteobacteria bacterium]
MNQSLLTLICPPSLERPISTWLLEHEKISGFTTKQAYGHGSKPDTLDLIEQVEGRKKQIVFQIHVTSEIAEVIINDLKKDFKGTDIHYWLVPVIAAGQLDQL